MANFQQHIQLHRAQSLQGDASTCYDAMPTGPVASSLAQQAAPPSATAVSRRFSILPISFAARGVPLPVVAPTIGAPRSPHPITTGAGNAEHVATAAPALSSAPMLTVPPVSGRYGGAIVRLSDLRSAQPQPLANATNDLPTPPAHRHLMLQDNGSVMLVNPPASIPVGATVAGRPAQRQRGGGRQQRNRAGSSGGRNSAAGGQRRRTSSRGTAALETMPDGSLYAHSWSTVRGKRVLKYHGKTYRGTQAHRMWEQIKQLGGTGRGNASPSPSPAAPTVQRPRTGTATATPSRKRARQPTTAARPAKPVGRHRAVSALVLSQAEAPSRRRRNASSSPDDDGDDDSNEDGFIVADEDVDSISATSSSRQSSSSSSSNNLRGDGSRSVSTSSDDLSEWESFPLSTEDGQAASLRNHAAATGNGRREVFVISESEADEEDETLLERAARLRRGSTAPPAVAVQQVAAAVGVQHSPPAVAAVVPPPPPAAARCAFTIFGRRPVDVVATNTIAQHPSAPGRSFIGAPVGYGGSRVGFSERYESPVTIPDGLAGSDLFTTSEVVGGYNFS